MPLADLTRGRSIVPAAFPLAHPFVRFGCPVVLIVAALQFDGISFLIGVALCAVLVALSWPREAAPALTADDLAGYPFDEDSLARARVVWDVAYEVETGEVVDMPDLLPAPDDENMNGITPLRLGSGR